MELFTSRSASSSPAPPEAVTPFCWAFRGQQLRGPSASPLEPRPSPLSSSPSIAPNSVSGQPPAGVTYTQFQRPRPHAPSPLHRAGSVLTEPLGDFSVIFKLSLPSSYLNLGHHLTLFDCCLVFFLHPPQCLTLLLFPLHGIFRCQNACGSLLDDF